MKWLFDRLYFYPLIPLALCLLIGSALPAGVQAQSAALPCPAPAELDKEWRLRQQGLSDIKAGLETFTAGQGSGEVPLNALFLIDLDDENKVAQRVKALQAELAATSVNLDRPESDVLLFCLARQNRQVDVARLLGLQRAVAGLRLQFLSLPPAKRAAILHPQLVASQQADSLNQLQQEHRLALAEQNLANRSLARAEQQVLTADAGADSDLAAQRAELERSRQALTALQVKWLGDLEKQAGFYRDMSEKLAGIAHYLLHASDDGELETQYEQAVTIWRQLVDNTRSTVGSRFALKLPDLPAFPVTLLRQLGDNRDTDPFRTAYREAGDFRTDLQNRIAERLQEGVDLHYRVLLQSGEIRSQLLNMLLDRGRDDPLAWSMALLQDIRREIAIVPYRWSATFYLRWLEMNRRLHQDWRSVAEMLAELALAAGFLSIPWLFWLASHWLSNRLSFWRIQFVRRSRSQPQAIHLALAIQKIQPYSAWLLMLLALHAGERLLAATLFSELVLILPYLRYYVYYRLFRQLMQCDFLWLNQKLNAGRFSHLRERVDVLAGFVGLSALAVVSLLAAIESLIRRGLVYHLSIQLLAYLALVLALGTAYQWRAVLGETLGKMQPGWLGEKLAAACTSRWSLLLALPLSLLLLLLLSLRVLRAWIGHFELARRLAAQLFRYQLETAIEKEEETGHTPLADDYRQYFSLVGVSEPELLQEPAVDGLAGILTLMKNWLNGQGLTHSLAIVGHKGMGKTCLLDYLQQISPCNQVIRLTVGEKLTTREQILALFGAALSLPLSEQADCLARPGCIESPTLVLVDDAHNLFLATPGGFEGFNTMLALLTQSKNLFWCIAFNQHAWSYLNSVNSQHRYFGAITRLEPWKEYAVQRLILSMHKKTRFHLSYDDIIQAAGSQNASHAAYIENRFFALLWQQSRGNPRLAVYLWLSSLHQTGSRALRVGLPDEPDASILADLPDDALFVLASIARHENLTLAQLLATTQLPETAIRYVLELGLRLQLLDCQNESVYRLGVLYQYPLIRYLQAKHCLYE